MTGDDHGTRTGTAAAPLEWALAGGVLLRVATGVSRGRELLLAQGSAIVGSHESADLSIDDARVSRRHVELAIALGGVRVKDLGSKNGTFLGETRVDSVVVPLGTEVRIGDTCIALLVPGSPQTGPRADASSFGRLVGAGAAAGHLFAALAAAAQTDAPVLLEGEPGTGKSEAARAIHEASPRATAAPIVLDLERADAAALDGSATAAEGSTLIVDRLELASSSVQARLVALMAPRPASARIVMIFRGDARRAVEEGRLHRELAFAAAHRITMPSLADRVEDLPILVASLAADLGHPDLRLDPIELAMLRAHRPEDNLHGLRRAIERGLSYAREAAEPTLPDAAAPRAVPPQALATMSFKDAKQHVLDEFERDYVSELLRAAGGNVSRAAAKAGLDRNHLAHLASKHGLRGRAR